MYCWMHDSAWVNIVEQLECEEAWQSNHLNCKWHQVPKPKLELLMPSGNKLSSSNVANNSQLCRKYLVTPSKLLVSAPFGVGKG
jgi:hypothetical protein